MADVLLDTIYEITKVALQQNNMHDQIIILKDHANFRMIVTLKNWTKLELYKEVVSDDDVCDPLLSIPQAELDGDIQPCHLSTPAIIKEELSDEIMDNLCSDGLIKCELVSPQTQPNAFPSHMNGGARKSERVKKMVLGSLKETSAEFEFKNETFDDPEETEKLKRLARKKKYRERKREKKRLELQKKREKEKKDRARVRARTLARRQARRKEKPRFQCEFCDFTSNKLCHYKRHTSTHSSEKPIACTLCDYRCKREDLLNNHMKKHMGGIEKPYICDQCEYRTFSNSTLMQHIRLKHSDIKPFSCRFCDFTSKLLAGIQRHEASVHEQSSEVFKCSQCDFSTVDEKRCIEHVKAHEQNISHSCHVCSKSFMLKLDLKHHLRRHTVNGKKEKPKPCLICNKQCQSTERLKSHMFLHTGIMEFSCRICGSGFRLHRSLEKHHTKKHPGELVYHCAPCDFQTNSKKVNNQHLGMVSHLRKVADSGSDS